MSKTTLSLDAILDPAGATVLFAPARGFQTTGATDTPGHVSTAQATSPQARFDLTGLPRIDAALIGRPVNTVPEITKRLCGICPVAHHLAGVSALEDLLGYTTIPDGALAVRRLLGLGSELDQLAPRFLFTDPTLARELKKVGKLAMTAAGCPGHFPDVAVPGGVRSLATESAVAQVSAEVEAVLPMVASLLDRLPDSVGARQVAPSALVRLVDAKGAPDFLGRCVEVFSSSGAGPKAREVWDYHEWPSRCREVYPDSAAPRPEIRVGAAGAFVPYSVGPIAQCGAQTVSHERALALAIERTCLELAELCTDPALTSGDIQSEPSATHAESPWIEASALSADGRQSEPAGARVGNGAGTHTGIGMVDGPRGLLVHVYTADAQGTLTACQILTPTAQNEGWMAAAITAALGEHNPLEQELPAEVRAEVEAAIRAADPCLPCTIAPPGQMNINYAPDPQPINT